jgi:hypothetical protein
MKAVEDIGPVQGDHLNRVLYLDLDVVVLHPAVAS